MWFQQPLFFSSSHFWQWHCHNWFLNQQEFRWCHCRNSKFSLSYFCWISATPLPKFTFFPQFPKLLWTVTIMQINSELLPKFILFPQFRKLLWTVTIMQINSKFSNIQPKDSPNSPKSDSRHGVWTAWRVLEVHGHSGTRLGFYVLFHCVCMCYVSIIYCSHFYFGHLPGPTFVCISLPY